MSNAERLRAISEANYARAFDAVKFLAAGNGGGALSMVTALHTLSNAPLAAVVFAKIAAVGFLAGIFISALAYRFIFSGILDFDQFAHNLRPQGPDESVHQSGAKSYRRGTYAAMTAMNFSFGALICAFIALLVYVIK